jgi:hypothetical protein
MWLLNNIYKYLIIYKAEQSSNNIITLIMSKTSPIIYNVANINDALSTMPSYQSNKLPLDVVIYVRASAWEACLLKINKYCGTK